MASKRRIRRNQCGNKRKFGSIREAFRTAKIIIRKKGETESRVSAYRCSFCGSYHWGNRR